MSSCPTTGAVADAQLQDGGHRPVVAGGCQQVGIEVGHPVAANVDIPPHEQGVDAAQRRGGRVGEVIRAAGVPEAGFS